MGGEILGSPSLTWMITNKYWRNNEDRKSLFCDHHNNWFTQESSMETKRSSMDKNLSRIWRERDYLHHFKLPPHRWNFLPEDLGVKVRLTRTHREWEGHHGWERARKWQPDSVNILFQINGWPQNHLYMAQTPKSLQLKLKIK